jgi:uncharacterized protein (DUF1697 family)
MRQIALLRGVNVGGNRPVAMTRLRETLTRLGYEDVATLLQSGNVVLTSEQKPAALETALARQLSDEFGARIEVVVRTRAELARVIERNPLAGTAENPSRHLVHFLSAKLTARRARELEALAVSPERLIARGRELYVWHPDGIRDSQLAALLARGKLGVVSTARNWNTVTKLLVLADR